MDTDTLLQMRSVTVMPDNTETRALVWRTWPWTLYSYVIKGWLPSYILIDNELRFDPSVRSPMEADETLQAIMLFELARAWGYMPPSPVSVRHIHAFDTACHNASDEMKRYEIAGELRHVKV